MKNGVYHTLHLDENVVEESKEEEVEEEVSEEVIVEE